MFLGAWWLEARDRFLEDSFLGIAGPLHCQTGSGARNGREIMGRFAAYPIVDVQQTNATYHNTCAWNARSPITSKPINL